MKPETKKVNKSDVAKIIEWQKSPIAYIKDIWGLVPQKIKPDKAEEVKEYILSCRLEDIVESHFEPFVKGENITWQQCVILWAIELALEGKAPARISVKSGHGIGKSSCFAWLILWYLTCFLESQIPCTAPTSEQMHDVLWKELSIWINKMPKAFSDKFMWSTDYVRINEAPQSWFARAKTARKENPEALAGVHGEYVMMCIDEASGIPEVIFRTAEGALTNANTLVIMASNPTRLLGYFYDTHHLDAENWQNLSFNSEESPIVESTYCERMAQKHGIDSDEYRIRVLGLFAREDAIDNKGYVPLLSEKDLRFTTDDTLIGHKKLGVDPAGEGSDKTEWVARDNFRAMNVATEALSTSKGIALNTLTLMTYMDITGDNVWIDNFGVGANVSAEIALAGKVRTNAVNVGRKTGGENQIEGVKMVEVKQVDDLEFANLRAKAYWDMREWIIKGGMLVGDLDKWRQLLTIRYCRDGQGKIKIMSKELMRKEEVDSPDKADALMLTFIDIDKEVAKGFNLNNQKTNNFEEKRRFNQVDRME